VRPWVSVGWVALLSVAFVGALELPGLSDAAIVLLSDVGQLAAAAGAAVACGRAAGRSTGQSRRPWALLAAGTGSWALGQVVWTYYEVGLGEEVPFPSSADVGYVLFPVLTAAGLLSWLGTQDALVARGRDLLDGTIIAVSLLALSWVTTLGSVVSEAAGGWLSVTLSLAYPISDVVLAALVLLALSRSAGERSPLLLVGAGLGGLAFADSAYVYMVAVGSYTSADLVSTGWMTGFLLVAAGALLVPPGGSDARRPRSGRADGATVVPSRLRLSLPYLPLVAAGVAICQRLLTAPVTPTVDLYIGISLVTLVLGRQFLAMAENRRLLATLAGVRDQLQHQALHDPLTGLANRTLFADRVEHALTQPDADVSLLYCDLDDFKHVNDRLGHEAGDELLRLIALRMLTCVRPADTVARLGGDEFAILLEHAGDAQQVADRVVETVSLPYDLEGTPVSTSVSVGVARQPEPLASPALTAQALLRSADTAMYAAKAAGKGRAGAASHVDSAQTPLVVPAAGGDAAG
jgi:diguanylate cyclase (GGDEF)-like protein